MPLALGRDLTALARSSVLDPVVGRDREIGALLRVLCRRTKSNPLLLGLPGVGKTALVEGVAGWMVAGRVPRVLRNRPLWEMHLGSLLAGTQFRGDLEKRVQDFLNEAQRQRAIVFVDEIHLLVLAGRGGGMDAANLLKPVLARSSVPFIGATTQLEAGEMFRVDPALERRFQIVTVIEPDDDTTRSILRALRPKFEAHHGIRISDDALEAALSGSRALGSTRVNPDRALDLLEDACAALQLASAGATSSDPQQQSELAPLIEELETAAADLDVERHARAREVYETHLSRVLNVAECAPVPILTADLLTDFAAERARSDAMAVRLS